MFLLNKKILFFLLTVLFLFILVQFSIIAYQLFKSPLIKQGQSAIKVMPGADINQLANQMHQQGLLKYRSAFIFWANWHGDAKKLHFGEYAIKPSMSAIGLLKNIALGKGLVVHRITFIEGWTFRDIKNCLLNNPDLKHLISNKDDAEVMALLGHPNEKPEGLFFPDTYLFNWLNTDLGILQKAHTKMQKILTNQWSKRDENLPYKNVYQALIVASMIEKETSAKEERPKVAGVIIHRLMKGMRLQIDPTVLYGLSKPYGASITKEDLLSETPYNTYRIKGLPLSPIGMPGAASIIAALHPDLNNNYLYYVSRGNGTHEFSETYQRHLQGVKKLRNQSHSFMQLPDEIKNNSKEDQNYMASKKAGGYNGPEKWIIYSVAPEMTLITIFKAFDDQKGFFSFH